MDVETHEILFSFDQPASVLPSLLVTIQQLLGQLKTRSGKSVPLYGSHCVLVIDAQRERAAYLVQALSLGGYRVLAVPHALEAFTLFLQGTFVPLLIIIGQDDPTKRFFQQRLTQQMAQKFDVEVPVVRLMTQMGEMSGRGSGVEIVSPFQHANKPVPTTSVYPPLPDSLLHSLPSQQTGNSYSRGEGLSEQSFSGQNEVFSQASVYGNSGPGGGAGNIPMQSGPVSLVRNIYTQGESGIQSGNVPMQGGPVSQPGNAYRQDFASANRDLSSRSERYEQVPFPLANPSARAGGNVPDSGPAPMTSPLQAPIKKLVRISLEGQSLGRYQIDTVIGKGPLGDVYQVYDRLRENRAALKAVQSDMVSFGGSLAVEEEDMFQREAMLLNRLKHERIALVLNTGKSYISGSSFIYKTMPYYAEGTLTQWLYEHGGQKVRPPREILPLILQLADALQFVHDQQVLFLNFKPGNILLKEAARTIAQVDLIISDFSVPFDHGSLPIANDALPYIAPERWEGKAQPASDQYALAVLAYELLTGRPLFLGTNESIMKRLHQTRQPQSPSTLNPLVPSQVSSILLRALAKKPEERFASVGLFAQSLQHFV